MELHKTENYAGHWEIHPGFIISFKEKPSKWKIFWTYLFLGWKWKSNH